MATNCELCKKEIDPATPTVESVGGFFDPDDPQFFVIDQEVMPTISLHRNCFVGKVIRAGE